MSVTDLKTKQVKNNTVQTLGERVSINLLSNGLRIVSRGCSLRLSAVFALRLKSFNILFMLEESLPMSEDAEGALSCIEDSDKGGLSSTTLYFFSTRRFSWHCVLKHSNT